MSRRTPRPYDLVDYVATSNGVHVTWQDDDEESPTQHTAEISLEYQSAERDVGIHAGWVADGDAPEWVLEWAQDWASERDCDAADDASERRADYLAEVGW